jgi:phenylpyruvate tautomerase PptA (4-oxalocrotonate tautomerase family)
VAQVKIYGLRATIDKHRAMLSEAIHNAVMDALSYPAEKRFHRFIALESENFAFPSDRTHEYIIIEISMFEGRSIETKKALVHALYNNISSSCGISVNDVEITIFETPKENWGIRGMPGDELALNYKVDV